MKRTFRSLLSMVMVLSMILSMVLVSGLTASAANARVHYITADQVRYSGNDALCLPSTLTSSGNSWKLTLTSDAAASVIGAVILSDPSTIEQLPFLVVNMGEDSTAAVNWLAWSETSGYVWPMGDSYVSRAGATLVYDLRNAVKSGETFTIQWWAVASAGTVFSVDSMYLTDVNPNADIKYVEAADLPAATTGAVTVTDHASGHGFDIVLNQDIIGGIGVVVTPNKDYTYMVIELENSTMQQWGITEVHGGWVTVTSGKWVVETATLPSAFNLWVYGSAGTSLTFKSIYYANSVETDVLMKDWGNNPYINVSRTEYGTTGKGLSLSGAWTDGGTSGYWYPLITGEQIAETPYLVVKPSATNFHVGVHFDITNGGDLWTSLQPMSATSTLQIYDLAELSKGSTAADKSVYLLMTFTGACDFDLFYLTSDKDAVVDVAAPEQYVVHMKDVAVAVKNISVNATGSFGLTYDADPAVTGDQYVYYNTLPKLPYLVYKLKEGSADASLFASKGAWWVEYLSLPTPSTERTVVDLTSLANYDPAIPVHLQTFAKGATEYEYFFFTNDPDYVPVEETEVPNHTVSFVTNGGSKVYSQLVADGGLVDAVTTTKTGYVVSGWYTDKALTEEFDFATAVTADMTLYAKWAIDGDISPVSAQLQVGVTAESESAAIRFVAVLDSRQFAEAGFVFSRSNATPTVGDASSKAVTTDTVWTSINAAGSTVTAAELHGSYIFACTVNGIGNANFDADIYVRAYVKNFDGSYTYTDVKTYSVNGMLG